MARKHLVEHHVRPRLHYIPEWVGPFENYARAFVARNHWRVRAKLGSEEDAVQQCAVVFVRCSNKYQATVEGPPHFMALFKTALAREFHTYATQDLKYRHDDLDETQADVAAPRSLASLLAGTSNELRELIGALIDAPEEIVEWIFGSNGLANYDRRGIARRAGRLLGISVNRDTITSLAQLVEQD